LILTIKSYLNLNLPIEQYPDITPPVVEVSATYDGADAETVNNAVATPVAQSVMGVSDMLYLQTTSANDGSMVLQVTFDIGSDPDLDAIFTQNNVSSATAELPATVTRQCVVSASRRCAASTARHQGHKAHQVSTGHGPKCPATAR
jgi:HAE1 family hydrophobic/amphiphilic exporter-1